MEGYSVPEADKERQLDIDSLKKIAIFLEGVKLGRGGNDIQPLGTYDIDQLWGVIDYFQKK